MTKHLTVAMFTLSLALTAPAYADDCPYHGTIDLRQRIQAFQVARPDGEEMCFTIPKSAGIAAGRITVVTVRPFLRAGADEIEVHTTTERTRQRGGAPHTAAAITAPELLGGGQIFLNGDDATHTTIRVRPRHRKDYRLIVVAHEIDLPQVLGAATMESLAAMMLAEVVEQMLGKDAPQTLLLDERLQGVVLDAFLGVARGQSADQIAVEAGLGLAINQALAGQDLPRPLRIAVASFAVSILRELGRGAMARYEWTLPDHLRDTSKPRIEARW